MAKIDALESKLKELEKVKAPARLWVVNEWQGRITCDGTAYTREQFEELVTDDDTVIYFVCDDDGQA